MNDNTLISFGSAIKNLGGGKIGGHLVLFGSPDALDLDGEFFAADTNFDIEDGDRRSGYYDHGLDIELGNTKIGTGTLKKDAKGVWLEAQLDTRKAYVDDVLTLVDAGAVGFSSGAVAHLVRREKSAKGSKITDWPIGEWSITPRPADPRTQVLPLKSWQPEARSLKSLLADGESPAPVEVKSELLGETLEEDMTMAALQRLNDALMMSVMSVIYGYWDMPMVGSGADEADDAKTPAQKVAELRPAFAEFMDKSLAIIEAVLSTEPPEPSEPSTDAVAKSVIALLRPLPLKQFLQTERVIGGEVEARIARVRAMQVKSGRTHSAETTAAITAACDGMQGHVDNLRSMVTPGEEKSAVSASDIDAAMLLYQLDWARSLGVSV